MQRAEILNPINDVLLITAQGLTLLAVDQIKVQDVGSKAFGLLSIPKNWTLPFFVVSGDLLEAYQTEKSNRETLVNEWAGMMTQAIAATGLQPSEAILIRSSAISEGITARGKFHTKDGTASNVADTLRACLDRLTQDKDLAGERVPLLIQKQCAGLYAKGHLSNERRLYSENRDWLGEFEKGISDNASSFQINLRRWRKQILVDRNIPLTCRISARISSALEGPAAWAQQLGARVHFEWVWDGSTVYLVQADEENYEGAHNPVADFKQCKYQTGEFAPKCLRLINAREDAEKFAKIANVAVYSRLELITAKLYILSDESAIKGLANGIIPAGLKDDLTELVRWSLVIRTDLQCKELEDKQLLPTLPEAKTADEAIGWMIERSKKFQTLDKQAAFIFHNFIPAQSSAYALAEPHERIVQIEALWGLPQGLYYNPTDKAAVDTMEREFFPGSLPDCNKFPVQLKPHYKSNYLSALENRTWELRRVLPPHDWNKSITEEQCRRIAFESRRIAIEENRAVSIMWFVGVPECVAPTGVVPWYHESFDLTKSRSSQFYGKRAVFDKPPVIRTAEDVETLFGSAQDISPYSRIKVQPSDEKLLRDKDTLKKIGERAKKHSVTIVLEGAILSHAYYQLMNTGARVEVSHPFVGFEETLTFNKLVRDLIPDSIVRRGERITTSKIRDEILIKALKEKLVEEAYEVLDAKDLKSIIEELADVQEVIAGLLHNFKVSPKEVRIQQRKKREKRGGFFEGIVLQRTKTTLPSASQPGNSGQLDLQGLNPADPNVWTATESELRHRRPPLDSKTDRRELRGELKLLASVVVPVSSSNITLETNPEAVSVRAGSSVQGCIKGKRSGSNWTIELFVNVKEAQPSLPLGE